MLHLELQWRGGRYLMVKGRDFVVLRKQPEGLQVQALVLVVMAERQVFMLVVVGLVVFVVGVMQFEIAANAELLLVTNDVVDEVMKKCAHFEEGLHALIGWRTGRQNLEGKEDGQNFFHFRVKGN